MQIERLADGCQTKTKVLHERITQHRLKHVFIARKVFSNFSCVVLSHKIHTFKPNDKRTLVQQLRPSNPAVDQNKVITRHCGPLGTGQKLEGGEGWCIFILAYQFWGDPPHSRCRKNVDPPK